jgi:DnaJ-class molecular chaperone
MEQLRQVVDRMPQRRPPSIEDLLDGIFDSAQDALEDIMEQVREQAQDYVQDAAFQPIVQPVRQAREQGRQVPPRTRPVARKQAPQRTLYDVLEISPRASVETIAAAYKSLMVRNHPDKGGDERKAQEIAAAYTILKDQAKRREYDRKIGL